jgi:hypothetical protein
VDCLTDFVLVDADDRDAEHVDTLTDALDILARNDRFGMLVFSGVEPTCVRQVRPTGDPPAHPVVIFEPGGRDDTDITLALALKKSIKHCRPGVNDAFE